MECWPLKFEITQHSQLFFIIVVVVSKEGLIIFTAEIFFLVRIMGLKKLIIAEKRSEYALLKQNTFVS